MSGVIRVSMMMMIIRVSRVMVRIQVRMAMCIAAYLVRKLANAMAGQWPCE